MIELDCILAVFGTITGDESEEQIARAYAGAMYILDMREELKMIRRALTESS